MAKKLLKKLINPMQEVLLQRGYCPACTRKLDSIKNRDSRPNGTVRVECVCGRIYILENSTKNYRRALESEV
ncbi:hypothetical protein GF389_05520 [Candidatus Dojkabacteria bacterium]|nr:hypothetical protein [Candidatus Dojkabacteria bacterium]